MTPEIQSLLALLLVAAAATWLTVRAMKKRKALETGCGGGCGCPSTTFRQKLAASAKATTTSK